MGQVLEVMVEGYQSARGQVTGRTSQNKTLNFTVPEGITMPKVGSYAQVRVVRAHPNSLVGEIVCAEPGAVRAGSATLLSDGVRGRFAWKSKCEFVD